MGMVSVQRRVDPRQSCMTMHVLAVRCRKAADLLFDGGDPAGVGQFEHEPARNVGMALATRRPFLRGIR